MWEAKHTETISSCHALHGVIHIHIYAGTFHTCQGLTQSNLQQKQQETETQKSNDIRQALTDDSCKCDSL